MEVFEEQAIESTTQKPKIWKCFVDETITILDRSYVDSLPAWPGEASREKIFNHQGKETFIISSCF